MIEAALAGVEVPKIPLSLKVLLTLTGMGPCLHGFPGLHRALRVGQYVNWGLAFAVSFLLAIQGEPRVEQDHPHHELMILSMICGLLVFVSAPFWDGESRD